MATSFRKVIYAALAGTYLIAITKSVATFMTGSSAMLSEAIHSGADTGNQMLLYGLRRAKLPVDNEFPFGHGKELCFSTEAMPDSMSICPLMISRQPLDAWNITCAVESVDIRVGSRAPTF